MKAPRMSTKDNPSTPAAIARHFWGLPSGRLLVCLSASALTVRLLWGQWGLTDLAVVLMILAAWPFVEWLIHVVLLHFEPRTLPARKVGPWTLPELHLDPVVAQTHRAHHRDPWKLDHVMIPIHTYAYSLPLNVFFWFGLFEAPQALTGLTTVVLLGLHYEIVHLMAHCRWKPPVGYYRNLWRNHRLHHCKSEKHWMGVTMLFGDVALGTGGHPKDVETSPTCRSLGFNSAKERTP